MTETSGGNTMKELFTYATDERIILVGSALAFALLAVILIKWNVKGEYIGAFIGIASTLIGSLTRGITGRTANSQQNTEPPKQNI
jgi:hypothetical protein